LVADFVLSLSSMLPVPRELRLIASRDDIMNPTVTLSAESPFDLENVKAIIWDLDGTLTLPHQVPATSNVPQFAGWLCRFASHS
jgi:hypothetical protein